MKTIFDLLFGIFETRAEARALRGTEKGEKTVKYTVVSILQSLCGVGFAYLVSLLIASLQGTEGLGTVAAFPILGLFAGALGFCALVLFLHAINNVACQRLVNRKPVRFLALGVNLASFLAAVLLVALRFA